MASSCPRCGSGALDAGIDLSRAPGQVARSQRYGVPSALGCFAIIAAFFTGGITLLALPILGIYVGFASLVYFSRDAFGRKDPAAEAAAATRYHCRMCGLDWYESEREAITAQVASQGAAR